MKKFNFKDSDIVLTPFFDRGEGEGGDGGDGGDGGTNIQDTPEFKAAVQSAVESAVGKATDGLKNKNDELLGKLKKAEGTAKAFEGLDPEQVKTMMENFNQSEEMKLIAEGKFDEVMAKRMDSVTAQHKEQLGSITQERDAAVEAANKYKGILDTNTIKDAVRAEALKANVLPEALDDVRRRALDVFSVDKEGNIECRDENGQLVMTEGLLMNPERFVSSLKKSASHYWPASSGAGADGNRGGDKNKGAGTESLTDIVGDGKNFDMDKYRAQRKAMGGDNYHKRR